MISEMPVNEIIHSDVAEVTRLRVVTNSRIFECNILIVREDEGFSAHCATLPGVVSEGDTVDEAIEHITEALSGALALYLESGRIPWRKNDVEGKVEAQKWILVDV